MAEAAEDPGIWEPNPPLYATRLLGAGVRLVQLHWKPLAVLAVVLTALTVAIRLAARVAGASASGIAFTTGYVVYEALVAVATGIVSGLMLRVFLADGKKLAPDRPLMAYTGLVAAAALVSVITVTIMTSSDPGEGMAEALKVPVGAALTLASIYVFTKLLLWPIGVLLGDATMTPRRSWSLMHKASWGYIFAMVLAFLALLPIYVILMLPMGGDADTAPVPFVVVEHLATSVWVAVSTAVAAAVYRARVLGVPLA